MLYVGIDYNEIKLRSDKDAKHLLDFEISNKHFEVEILIDRAAKTTIQILSDKG